MDGDGKATSVALRCPGQIYDASSQLSYNYFRDYNPDTGRYVQSDPIGLNGGANTYGYVGGNPLTGMDIFGLDREIIFWGAMLHDPTSWMGHVSSRGADGSNFSFGPGGWDTQYPTADDYISRQIGANNRVGEGVVVKMTPEQDSIYDQCMSNAKSNPPNYSVLHDNCTSSSQACLSAAGITLLPSLSPLEFQSDLLNSDYVSHVNEYRAKP